MRRLLSALADPRSHSPRNPYWLLGLAWGLPFPLISFAGPIFGGLGWEHVILLYPWLSAALFGAFGTLRRRRAAEVARLMEEVKSANERLRKEGHLKTRFMAFVTHDLKSPLVAIRGYNEGILQERFGPLNEEQRAGLAVSVRNIDRLQSLIGQLGEFEHVDGEDFKLAMSDFDLVELVHEIVADFQPRIDAGHLTVQLRTAPKVGVYADRDRIGRVLTNLVANALTHSPQDAVVRIETYRGEEDGRVLVIVADRGAGIPTAAQEHMFARYAGGGAHRTEGTGLGLAICKGILDAHGSALGIVSSEGVGTTARFELALAEARQGRCRDEDSGGRRRSGHAALPEEAPSAGGP